MSPQPISLPAKIVRVTLLLALVLAVTSPGLLAADAVVVDRIDGLIAPDTIQAVRPVTLHFAYIIETSPVSWGVTGHRIYSPDGAGWTDVVLDTVPGLMSYWDGGIFLQSINTDGLSPDTVGFAGTSIFSSGLPVGYDSVVYRLSFTATEASAGKTICVDSSWFPPAAEWSWSLDNNAYISPAWDGPFCFTIVSCCVGMRGNADFDSGDAVNVNDLSFLVDYLFRDGPAPPCQDETDIDGNGTGPNVADVSALVEYLFKGGPPPAACSG